MRGWFEKNSQPSSTVMSKTSAMLAAEPHFERLAIKALAFAHLAWDKDIGEEVHFYFDETVALTCLATPTLHVEGEAPGPVPANLRLRHLGEQLANRRKESRVRRGIRPWRPTDRALVDVDDLVEMLEPRDAVMLARDHACAIEMASERAMQNVLDQRRLARTRHAGH